MENNDTIIKAVRANKDPGLWTTLFHALGELPGTEYRPTERERQRVRDHASHARGRVGDP